MRWLTAGESHGPELTAILEGMPAGVAIDSEIIRQDLARRRLGYGRGSRMNFEQDQLSVTGGVRHGSTMGSPISLRIGNTEWPKWVDVMSADPVDPEKLTGARAAPLTRPRPGHADLTGIQKYGFEDARPVLERASARETAARVALGSLAKQFLLQLGISTVSHTTSIAEVSVSFNASKPLASDTEQLDKDPLRCFQPSVSAEMVARVDAAHKAGQTLGGTVEVLVYGLPPGLGSYVQWDRKLDARIAAALMSIQAIKGVEIGDGFETAKRDGGDAHDELLASDQGIQRASDKAGGIEGGMSTGGVLIARAAMKPIATVPKALQTVDISTGETAKAHHQRSDVCAVPAAGVVAEAMVALVVAEAVLEKFGGDSLTETSRNLESYLTAIPDAVKTSGTRQA